MTDSIHPPTISDVAASVERTNTVLQRTINSFGPEGRAVLVPVHLGLTELTVLIKSLLSDIRTATEAKTADPDTLHKMERAAKRLNASIDDATRLLVTTKGFTERARLGVLDASEQARETAVLMRRYVVATLAAKRRKEDAP